MRVRDLLEEWGLSGLSLSLGFVDLEFNPNDPDRNAAWDLYVELTTRIATQRLPVDAGDEATALRSIFDLWSTLRGTLKEHRGCTTFARLAIPFFNQEVRPFTARWHRESVAGALDADEGRARFRRELDELRGRIRAFAGMLSKIADVEELNVEILREG